MPMREHVSTTPTSLRPLFELTLGLIERRVCDAPRVFVSVVRGRRVAHDDVVSGDGHRQGAAELVSVTMVMTYERHDDVTRRHSPRQLSEARSALLDVRGECGRMSHLPKRQLEGHTRERQHGPRWCMIRAGTDR